MFIQFRIYVPVNNVEVENELALCVTCNPTVVILVELPTLPGIYYSYNYAVRLYGIVTVIDGSRSLDNCNVYGVS